MRIRTIKYYIREAFKSIVMNRLMSVASIFTVASCIFIVSVFFILGSHVSFLVQQMGDTLGLVVFLEEDITQLQRQRLEMRIREIPNVTGVTYVSNVDALIELQENMDLNPSVLAGLEENNPLRSSLVIEITDVTHQERVASTIAAFEDQGVGGVRQDVELARILTTVSNVVQIVSLVLVFILGIVAIVIITNTINITVNARRTEINIMKYVGATDWFIRWPFIIEGVLIGLIGGAIPTLITFFGHDHVIGTITAIPELQFLAFVPRYEIFTQLIPFALVLGAAIGTIGSGVSVRKHLKV